MNARTTPALLLTPKALASADDLVAAFTAATSRSAPELGGELLDLAETLESLGAASGGVLRGVLAPPLAPLDVTSALRGVSAAELEQVRHRLGMTGFDGAASGPKPRGWEPTPAGTGLVAVPAGPAQPAMFAMGIEGASAEAAPALRDFAPLEAWERVPIGNTNSELSLAQSYLDEAFGAQGSPFSLDQLRAHLEAVSSGAIDEPLSRRESAVAFLARGVNHAAAYLVALGIQATAKGQLRAELPTVLPDTSKLRAKELAPVVDEAPAPMRATPVWGELPWLQLHMTELGAKFSEPLALLAKDNPAAFGGAARAKLANWVHRAGFIAAGGSRKQQTEDTADLREELGLDAGQMPDFFVRGERERDADDRERPDLVALMGGETDALSGRVPSPLRDVKARLEGALVVVIEAARVLSVEGDGDRRRELSLRVGSVEELVQRGIRGADAARAHLRDLCIPVPGDPGVQALDMPRLKGYLPPAPAPSPRLA